MNLLTDDDIAELARGKDCHVQFGRAIEAAVEPGCAYCNNPLFAGAKCKNCGTVYVATPPDMQAALERALGALKDFDYDKRLAAIAEIERVLR